MGHAPMPSPIAHSLAATIVGWTLNRPQRPWRPLLEQTATLALIGMAPDLDIAWGRHSRETHSLGAALLCASVATWLRWPVGARSRWMTFATVTAAWFSHPLLDMFAKSDRPWPGVWMWWPLSETPVHSAYAFFDPISREWQRSIFWTGNFIAAVHELMLFVPLACLVWYVRRRAHQ